MTSQVRTCPPIARRLKIAPSRRCALLARSACLFAISVAFVGKSAGAVFTPGNLVVTHQDVLREYTLAGNLVQAINIPYPGPAECPACESSRDVFVHPNGRAYVYNGTFDPLLSEFEPAINVWTHRTFAGLSSVANLSYGGLVGQGRYVFMPDMRTFGTGDELQGIVRFDLAGGPTMRFAEDIEPFDLNIGLNGLLYALYPGGSPSGRSVAVFDPVSMARLKTIDVGRTDNRGVAADFDGSLFLVSWSETLYHMDSDGNVLKSLPLPASDTFDVDIDSDGAIVIGSRFGEVMLTDRNLSSITSFSVGGSDVFVSFVTVPEPSTMTILTVITATCFMRRARRWSKSAFIRGDDLYHLEQMAANSMFTTIPA
jgi:hypothetical protein